MATWEKLMNIDRKWVYLGFVIVTALPLLFPFQLPMSMNPMTKVIYDEIEGLKPGEVVLFAMEYSASMYAELHPPMEAVYRHVMKRPGVKAVFFSTTTDSPLFAEQLIKDWTPKDKAYGEAVINLGFRAGGEAAITAVAEDVWKTFPTDYRGNKIDAMPMMSGIKSIKNIRLVIQNTGGSLGPLGWIRQVFIPSGVKIVSILGQDMAVSAYPYVNAGQIVGLVPGLRGSAEYEKLHGYTAKGAAGMGVQTLAMAYFMVFIILPNIGYLVLKGQKTGK